VKRGRKANQKPDATRKLAILIMLVLAGMNGVSTENQATLKSDQIMKNEVVNVYRTESLRIQTQRDFHAPAGKVWKIIAGFNSLPDYHASIFASELKEGGAVRHITMSDEAGGGVVVERLVFFDDVNRTFSYRIIGLIDCEMAFRNYQAWVHLESTGTNSCRLHWGSSFDVEGATDAETDELARVIYKGCFDGIQRVLETRP